MTVAAETGNEGIPTEHVVVLRARSGARFLPEEGWEFNVDMSDHGMGTIRLRAFTRWVAEGKGVNLPRELVIEARGMASTIGDAIQRFSGLARPFATLVAFVANVSVGQLEVHIAFQSAATSKAREFVEVFLPDEKGSVSEGRIIRLDLLSPVSMAFATIPADPQRIARAFLHYELALRNWYLGGEWLALNHLWIAAENLTKAVVRKIVRDRGITEEELASEYGLVTNDPDRPRWRDLLGARIRSDVIFAGDSDTYQAAKKASDGIEHGILELDKIAQHALKAASHTFAYLRSTLVMLLDVDPAVEEQLNAIKPKDTQSSRRVVSGRILGAAEDPAAPDELYPILRWSSAVEEVVREDTTFTFSQKERFNVWMHPDVTFKLERYTIQGRLLEGEATAQVPESEVVVAQEPRSDAAALLARVMPLVDRAAAAARDTALTREAAYATQLYSQGVANFQSAHSLLSAGFPVEALSCLRNLVVVVARFEQMADRNNGGLGIAVRLAASLFEMSSTSATAQRLVEILDDVTQRGITVPEAVEPPEDTTIFRRLGMEMRLADDLAKAGYSTIALHLRRDDDGNSEFHVTLPPGPLTDMVGSAAVLAMLELLKFASGLLGLTTDLEAVEALLVEAVALNESSSSELQRMQ